MGGCSARPPISLSPGTADVFLEGIGFLNARGSNLSEQVTTAGGAGVGDRTRVRRCSRATAGSTTPPAAYRIRSNRIPRAVVRCAAARGGRLRAC